MVHIFLTGASGYIGGQVLYELSQGTDSISALVRNADQRAIISQKYPEVKIVEGDLDSSDIIKREVSVADIVLHLAHNKHIKSVQTIADALLCRDLSKPIYYIQVSGASLLAADELASPSFSPGEPSAAIFDDYDGASQICKLIRAHPTRVVDNYVLDLAAKNPGINTALIFPPIIYGKGQGPINQRSIQVPTLARITIERKNGIQMGKGLNQWSNVHIRDLGRLISKLVHEAARGQTNERMWSEHGLYLTGSGETTFAHISQTILASAKQQGLVSPEAVVEELAGKEADTILPYGSIMYGTNARGQGRRAQELLGWKAQEACLEEDIPRTVAMEAVA